MPRLLTCWTVLWAVTSLLPCRVALAQSSPALEKDEHILLGEVFRLASQLQDTVWTHWSDAPFGLLFVTPEHEWLIHHPQPSDDFTFVGRFARLDSVYVRKRQLSPTLRATFPAVGGVPTIVIGRPDSTEGPTDWLLTALHEHFHQWQMSRPEYYAAVDSLGLSRGDETGQWMLTYPFPYDSTAVECRFGTLTRHLNEALLATDQPDFPERIDAYLQARRRFQDALDPDDYRYFSFQLWQEGVARYIEYKTAKVASQHYVPTEMFRSLAGYKPFADASGELKDRIMRRLSALSLGDDRRVAFYPVGAAEALLLDRVNPDWPEQYWKNRFYLERHFSERHFDTERKK